MSMTQSQLENNVVKPTAWSRQIFELLNVLRTLNFCLSGWLSVYDLLEFFEVHIALG